MVVSLTSERIKEYLQTTREKIVFIMPSIHKEWIDVMKENQNLEKLSIYTCIDNSEACIRNGYGNIESIEYLKEKSKEMLECADLKVHFVMFDNEAYCLFLESRILVGEPQGYNAIKVNGEIADSIVSEFFVNTRKNVDLFAPTPKAIPLNVDKYEETKKALLKNPPDAPDLSRKIKYYNNLFQFCELNLIGGNISSKTISIPPSALPFKDEKLKSKMRTKFELFDKDATKGWDEMNSIKLKDKEIRDAYLVPCTPRKDKSVLKKVDKSAFLNEIKGFKKFIEVETVKLKSKVQDAINQSEDVWKMELKTFLLNNLTDKDKGLTEEQIKRNIDSDVNRIISKTKFPTAHELVSKIQYNVVFYDMTWEDLSDEKLLKWFETNELIEDKDAQELARFTEGFGLKGFNQ